ncbi:hypothetical protein ACQKMN_04300 [Ureibacillus composti]
MKFKKREERRRNELHKVDEVQKREERRRNELHKVDEVQKERGTPKK